MRRRAGAWSAVLAMVFTTVFSVSAACSKADEGGKVSEATEGNVAVLVVKDMGTIKFEFLPDKAPNHVENFKKLARDGFYDGTIFHRVIPGFMIQGGDPTTKDHATPRAGTGGPGYTIDAEFNDTKHVPGVVSMARTADPNSAGSQFFIMVGTAKHLDGQYTAFGKVTEGMDVVYKIAEVPRGAADRPKTPVVLEKVTIE